VRRPGGRRGHCLIATGPGATGKPHLAIAPCAVRNRIATDRVNKLAGFGKELAPQSPVMSRSFFALLMLAGPARGRARL